MSTRRSFLQAVGMSAAGLLVPERFARAAGQQMLLAAGAGISAWSSSAVGTTATYRSGAGAGGNSAVMLGGTSTTGGAGVLAVSDVFNGTSWSSVSSLTHALGSTCSAGTASDAICAGGNNGGGGGVPYTDKFNGTTWTATGNLSQGRTGAAAAGLSSTAAIVFGGQSNPDTTRYTSTEAFNGSAYSAGGAMPTAIGSFGGCGSATDAISCGGWNGSAVQQIAQTYNGSAWSSITQLTVTVYSNKMTGATSGNSLSVSGHNGTTAVATVNKWSGAAWSVMSSSINVARSYFGISCGSTTSAVLTGGHAGSTVFSSTEVLR